MILALLETVISATAGDNNVLDKLRYNAVPQPSYLKYSLVCQREKKGNKHKIFNVMKLKHKHLRTYIYIHCITFIRNLFKKVKYCPRVIYCLSSCTMG